MKLTRIWQLVAVLLVTAFPVFAQVQDLQITASKKKLDEQKARPDGMSTVKTKEIAYDVTVQNKRFKTMPEIQVKYMIFVSEAQPGSTEKPVSNAHKGMETLANLASNATVSFETKPFTLTTVEVDANVYYPSGAGSRARDKANGIWIRAYADGKIIGEYANPSTISKKNEWKD